MGTEKNDVILDFPFFTLEYREGVFVRQIPSGARDLGGGRFRGGGKTYRLPRAGEGAGSAAALAEDEIRGRALLHLINRGPNPLIKKGPRLAGAGERIMELVLAGGPDGGGRTDFPGVGPVIIEIRKTGEAAWQPLAGLPHHRYYQNTVYEIIDAATLRELAGASGVLENPAGASGSPLRLLLRGEDIPRFAEVHARLVWQFGAEKTGRLLAEESVFIKRSELSLILGAFAEKQGFAGAARAVPLVSCGGYRYSAKEVSLRMDREYLLFDRRWARRGDLEAIGLFPLGFYAGGGPLEKIRLKPEELLRRGGERFAGFFAGLEADMKLWIDRAGGENVFLSHLDFLLAWGLSGGVVAPGHREQVLFLKAWLARLSAASSGAGRAAGGAARESGAGPAADRGAGGGLLVLMERRYYELYFNPRLPGTPGQPPGPSGTVPGSKDPAPRIAFYEDLPPGPAEKWGAPQALVLVEPEEALLDEKENAPKEALLSEIRNLGAGIVLGIFSDARELLRARRSASLRALFGVREAGTEQYLIREIKKTLTLPGFEFPRPRIRRPAEDGTENSGPSGTGGFRATVESKFSGLSGPSLYSELASFRTEGPPVPFVPLRFSGKNPDFERLDKDERDFFLYWRGEFRRGRILKTGEGYIRLYARELCLFTGAGEGVEENFRELVRLLETYREISDSVDSFLPRWIFDFVWIYEKGAPALEPILDCAQQSNTPLLTDFYFHRHFIEENNSIEFGDVKALLPDKPFLRDFEIALNGIDHFLRERFRLRLFEFFYPPAAGAETIEAFPGMNGAGKSSYVIEGLRFSKSVPFLSFLEDLYRYTEYRFKIKKGLELKRGAPPLHEVWKELADRALGLEDRAPVPAAGRGLREAGRSRLPGPRGSASLEDLSPSPVPPLPSGELNESALERLRADSDAVRTLLTQDAADPPFPESRPDSGERPAAKPGGAGFLSPAPPAAKLPPPPETTLRSFLENLDGAERAALAFIAGVSEKEPKRAGDAMPELVVDRINAAFLEIFGDLLIDTVDERPSIQSEYREEVKKNLGGL